MPDCGWIKNVSPHWMSVITHHRPDVVNIWQTGSTAWSRVEAGHLVLLKRQGSVEDIIGFGIVECRMPAFTSTIWHRYGVANGASDRGEFEEQVMRRRTQRSVSDPVIRNIIVKDPVLFADRPFKLFRASTISQDLHVGDPIYGEICGSLLAQLEHHARRRQMDEARSAPGSSTLEQAASELIRHAWEDKVATVYRCCPVTGVRARDILRVVAIKPIELGGPLHVTNGLRLVEHLATLYHKRLIAFHLNGAVLVSPKLVGEDLKLYGQLAKKPLKPPKRAEDRPAHDFVQWRLDHYFER